MLGEYRRDMCFCQLDACVVDNYFLLLLNKDLYSLTFYLSEKLKSLSKTNLVR